MSTETQDPPIDNALPGLELGCTPDPCCSIDCDACANLPYGESVRKEQLAMMTASIRAQEVFSRVTMQTDKMRAGSTEAELSDMSMHAMLYGSAFASVLGLLLKEAPELAHRAVAIHQDMYSNGDTWFTEQLYEEAEAEVVAWRERIAARVAEREASDSDKPTAARNAEILASPVSTITPSEVL